MPLHKENHKEHNTTTSLKESLGLPSDRVLHDSSRCLTTRFQMNLNSDGCKTKTIMNSYCSGLCNSLFLPRDFLRFTDFNTCLICKPKKKFERVIFLDCEKDNDGEVVKYIKPVTVTIIKKCTCASCSARKSKKGIIE